MAHLPSMFVFLLSTLFVNSELYDVENRNSLENHDSEIAAVLHHLNTSSFRLYNYKRATLIHAHTKADIAELVLDVDVECLNKYPDVPCNAKVLTCQGFVQNGTQVLNDINCKPKPEIIIDEIPTTIPEATNETKTLVLSHEASSSEVSEPFIAVRKDLAPCLGCPFDLNPNVDGVEELVNLALDHVGSERTRKQGLVKVIRLQQQVVSGIKYILTVELRPTLCPKESQESSCPLDSERDSAICEITYLQKPWISKSKHIISNNCTISQEYVKPDEKKNDISNDINDKQKPSDDTPNFDHIAETGSVDETRLADLESQIIGIVDEAPSVTMVQNDAPETTVVPQQTRKRRAIPQLEKISPDEKPLVKNLADFAASALDNIDDDNHKRVVLQILGAKKMVGDDGVYYHLIMRMGISRCLEDKPVNPYENCREKLFENYTKICKVQVYVNDDFASPRVVKSQCQNIKRDKNDSNRTNYSRFRRESWFGAPNEISVESKEVRELLNEGVGHLNRRRDGNKLKPVEVLSATTQVAAGTLTRIHVKLAESECSKNDARELDDCKLLKGAEPKRCQIRFMKVPWKEIRQFKIKCDEQKQEYKIETKIRQKRELLVGGERQINVDRDDVKTLLHQGVGHLNAQRTGNKWKPVEVLSATSQVVAGRLIRINVKLGESDCGKNDVKELERCNLLEGTTPKKCEITVWEKGWENFRQFKIKCKGEDQEYKIETKIRQKREVLAGGQTQISVDREDVKSLLNQGVGHLNAQRDGNKLKPVEVLSATSQVVAGSLIRINAKLGETDCGKNEVKELEKCNVLEGTTPKSCQIKVWEKSWENYRQFKIKCDGDQDLTVETKIRRKRENGEENGRKREVLAGGQTQISVDRDDVKTLLHQGVGHLNAQRSGNKLKPVEVLSATSQVIAGSLIRINVKLGESDCGKNDVKELEKCNLLEGTTPKKCEIAVWEKGWENFRQFKIKCEGDQEYKIETKIRRKREVLVGGESEISVDTKIGGRNAPGGELQVALDDTYVQKYLESGLQELDFRSNNENKYKVHKIISATSQIVAGHVYRIKARVVLSDCAKTSSIERHHCKKLADSRPKTCNFVVFEQVWVPGSRKVNVTCEEEAQTPGLTQKDDVKLFRSMFHSFIKKYNKKYNDEEYKYRFAVFSENMLKIRVLNTYEQGTATYGVTPFADLTTVEFSRSRGYRPELRDENALPFAQAVIPDIEIPTEFDWRKKGVVTEVKNQEQCGSCWAFSVTGNVEGQYAIKHGKLLEFSEQELVDCDTEDQGCNGGLMDTAYRQIEKLGGLETEQEYPYDAEDEKCHFNKSLVKVQLSGAVNISQDEDDMAKWLVANGPISIAINANAMQFYFGGVSHPFKFLCNPKNLDHGVLIVGYGVRTYPLFNKTLPYWIVKNSWGPSWGEQGYYRVYRGDGTCGINQTPSSAIVV